MTVKKKKPKKLTDKEFLKLQQEVYRNSSIIWKDEIFTNKIQVSL